MQMQHLALLQDTLQETEETMQMQLCPTPSDLQQQSLAKRLAVGLLVVLSVEILLVLWLVTSLIGIGFRTADRFPDRRIVALLRWIFIGMLLPAIALPFGIASLGWRVLRWK